MKNRVEGIEDVACARRTNEIREEAFEQIEDSQKQLDEERQKADDELAKAEQELSDGEKGIQDGEKRIADGREALISGKAEISRQEETLKDAETQYENSLSALKSGKSSLRSKQAELEEGKQTAQKRFSEQETKIVQSQKELDEAKQQLDAAEQEIDTQEQALADGRAQLEAKKTEIMTASATLDQIQEEIEAGIAEAEQTIEEQQQKLEALGDQIAELMALINQDPDGATEEQRAQLATLQKQYADGSSAVEAAKGELEAEKQEAQARLAEIEKKRAELSDGQKALELEEADLQEKEAYFAESIAPVKEKLEKQKHQWEAGVQELEAGKEALAKAKEETEAQFASGEQQIAATQSKLRSSEAELSTAASQIASGKSQIQSAKNTIAQKERELTEAETELADGRKELDKGRKEYESQKADAESRLADAQSQINDARSDVEKLDEQTWYVNDRDILAEYTSYGENADRMRAIGEVFPELFFLVAALISLTTMTRMVEEERTQIGTMKALGYGKGAIAGKYLMYAFLATMGGSVFGVLIGEKVFPYIIIYSYQIMYTHLPHIVVPYQWNYAAMATAAALACTLLATLYACYKELAAQPAELMRPPSPKEGKRILLERVSILWRHLSFTWKSSVRNLFRYKKRFFMTIAGIGGCMALMVVGFGLKDCIYEIVSLQYEKVQFYDAATYMNDDISEENRQQIQEYLDQNADVKETIEVHMQKTDVKSASGKKTLYLMVPSDDEKIEDFLSFHSRTNKNEVYSLKKDEVILTEKMASLLNVKVGDQLTIEDEDRGDQTVTIGAICENYMSHYLYLSPEKYEELYGKPVEYNTIIYSVKDGKDDQIEKTGTKLLAMDGVLNVSYTSSIEGRLDDMLRSLNLVIVVLIVSAGMLAFVVLYNLNNINITERQRELATLKVLGFYDGEVASYVYRENILLTIIGSVVGMVLGNFLHRYTILTVEVEEAMFGRQIHWQSYLYSFLFTAAFSLFVNWVMFYKLKKIDMVESLKSVE